MVRPKHTAKRDLFPRLHAGQHVGLALVMKRLNEVLHVPSHIPEVAERDSILMTKVANGFGQIIRH